MVDQLTPAHVRRLLMTAVHEDFNRFYNGIVVEEADDGGFLIRFHRDLALIGLHEILDTLHAETDDDERINRPSPTNASIIQPPMIFNASP